MFHVSSPPPRKTRIFHCEIYYLNYQNNNNAKRVNCKILLNKTLFSAVLILWLSPCNPMWLIFLMSTVCMQKLFSLKENIWYEPRSTQSWDYLHFHETRLFHIIPSTGLIDSYWTFKKMNLTHMGWSILLWIWHILSVRNVVESFDTNLHRTI